MISGRYWWYQASIWDIKLELVRATIPDPMLCLAVAVPLCAISSIQSLIWVILIFHLFISSGEIEIKWHFIDPISVKTRTGHTSSVWSSGECCSCSASTRKATTMAFLWITLLKEAATINYGFLFVERTFAKLVPEHKFSGYCHL